ncbi:MAG TPA: serine hydrolase domain-containing protein [Daejeonella sp.]
MKLSALFICCIMITNTAQAQLEKKLDSIIANSIQPGEPGVALYVENNGKVIYKNAFGLTAINGKELDASTNFRMASVSKQFTAMCILLLEKDGKVSFDDPISRFFPEIPAVVADKVLLRHLLTHSSGVIDYESLMDASETSQLLDADVLALLSKQDTTYFAPGSQFRYSNSAYALLALITERVSGQSFPQFMKERIFKPLKMKNSSVYEASSDIKNRAMGFARNRNKELFANDQSSTSAVKGDGGVYTSLNDYRKWTHAQWRNTLVDLPSVLKRLNYSIREFTGSYYGPGLFYFDKVEPSLFHSGSTCGFSTFSVNIPGQKTSIVYYSNIANNAVTFKKILEILASHGIGDPVQVFQLHELTR